MKKSLVVLMLLISISGSLMAQRNNSEKIFELPPNSVTRIFYIDLDKSDKIKLELADPDDLYLITNLDSVLRVFVQDIEPLKDSLADELKAKRIDYVIDPSGKNKIRIQQFAPIGSSYVTNQGSIAAMKLEQDTVNMIFKANGNAPSQSGNKGFHYYRVSFFVNNLVDLAGYMNGRLQNSLDKLKKSATKKWTRGSDGMMHIKNEPGITSSMPRGTIGGSDYLNLKLSADIQNYKNYFVPSLSFGFAIITNRNNVKREYSLMGESHFTFAKDDKGKLQSFRNTFLTIGYSQTNSVKENGFLGFSPSFSLGYLVRQRGDIFDKHTFRIGFAKAMIFNGRVKLEPVVYFHDLFKNVTPGLRLSF